MRAFYPTLNWSVNPNLLQQNFDATDPNPKWVADY
jgi:hypothetical protein